MLRTKWTQRAFFLVICIMGFFAILSSTMSKNPVLKPFATSLGTPDDLLGIVASASTIPGILISLPAASLSDVFGRRKVLLFAAFVFASAPFLYLGVNSWWTLALVRFYHGFATAIFVPVAEASIATCFRLNVANAFHFLTPLPLWAGLWRRFWAVTYFLQLTKASSPCTLQWASRVLQLLSLLCFSWLKNEHFAIEPAALEKAPRKMFSGWLTIIKNTSVLGVSFVQAIQYFVFGSVDFFLVGYLTDVVKMNLFLVGIITGSEIIALVVVRPLIGRVSDRTGRTKPIIIGIISSCLLIAAIPFTTQFPLLLLLAVGYGASFATVLSSTSPLVCDLVPATLVGASMGFLSTFMDIGQTIGPIVSGVIFATNLYYAGMFLSLSVLLIISIAVFAVSKRRH